VSGLEDRTDEGVMQRQSNKIVKRNTLINFDEHLKSESFSNELAYNGSPTKDARAEETHLDGFWSNVHMPDRMQKYKESRPSLAQLQEERRERAVQSAKEHAQTVVVVRHTQPSTGKQAPPEVRDMR
jgi:hypothetical protein